VLKHNLQEEMFLKLMKVRANVVRINGVGTNVRINVDRTNDVRKNLTKIQIVKTNYIKAYES
jgi:hypothetical protein